MVRVRNCITIGGLLVALSGNVFSQEINNQSPSSQKQPASGWVSNKNELLLKDSNGQQLMRFALKHEVHVIARHPSEKFTEKHIVSLKGGASNNGHFAWVDQRKATWLLSGNKGSNDFRYYDGKGQLLWEKRTVVNAHLINDGRLVALFESTPKAIATLEYGVTLPLYSSTWNVSA